MPTEIKNVTKPNILSGLEKLFKKDIPESLGLQNTDAQKDARFAIAGAMADEEVAARLQDPVIKKEFADEEAIKQVHQKQAETKMGVSAEEYDKIRMGIYDNLDDHLASKGIYTPKKQMEQLVTLAATAPLVPAAMAAPGATALGVGAFTAADEGLKRTLFPAIKNLVEGKPNTLSMAGAVGAGKIQDPVSLKQAIGGEGQLSGAVADIAELAAKVGITHGAIKGAKAISDSPKVQSAIQAAKYRIQKAMGIDVPAEVVPYDYAKAVNEGRISLAEAARKSKIFYETELSKRMATPEQQIKTELAKTGDQPMAGGSTIKEAASKYDKNIKVISEEDYLAQSGASRQDIGDSALHKNRGGASDKTWSKIVNRQAEKDRELLDKREALRKEYNEKVESGELRPPTREESLIRTAQGNPDNESVQAARRLLDKKGIRWREELVPKYEKTESGMQQVIPVQPEFPSSAMKPTDIQSEDMFDYKKPALDKQMRLLEPSLEDTQREFNFSHGNKDVQKSNIEKTIGKVEIDSTESVEGIPVKKTRSRLSEELRKKQYVDHVGREVRHHGDVAELASVFRSPYIENMQVMYVKDGKVVAHNVVSSGAPNYVDAGNTAKFVYRIISASKRLGADDVYLAHNHPSGNHLPSPEDIQFTRLAGRRLQDNGIKLKGHVVTNGDKFTLLSAKEPISFPYITQKQEFVDESISDAVSSYHDIVKMAKSSIENNANTMSVFFLDNKNRVLEHRILRNNANIYQTVKQGKAENVASRYIVVLNKDFPLKGLKLPSGLLDIIKQSEIGYLSLESTGIAPERVGIEVDKQVEKVAYRVQEKTPDYADVTLDDFLYGRKDLEKDFDNLPIEHQRDIAWEAEEKIQIADSLDTPEANPVKAIRLLGGISVKGLGEEWSWLPVYLRGKMRPDDIATEIKKFGFNFEREEDFRLFLKDWVESPADKFNKAEMNRFVQRYKRNLKIEEAVKKTEPPAETEGFYDEPVTFKTGTQLPEEAAGEISPEGMAVPSGSKKKPVQIDLSGVPEKPEDINKGRKVPEDIKSVLVGKAPELFNDLGKIEGSLGGLTTTAPLRAVEKMDGKQYGIMKERFLKPIQQADMSYQIELKAKKDEAEELFKGMSREEREAVFGAAEQDITSKDKALIKKNPRIESVAKRLRDIYDELIDRINKEREAIGKDPIQKRKNYITHYLEMTAWQDIARFVDDRFTEVPASMAAISLQTKPNSPYFKYAKRRETDLTMRDAKEAYLRYIDSALRFVHFARAIKNGRDIIEYRIEIPSEYEGGKIDKVSAFAVRYPNAYQYFTNYLNRLAGKRDIVDKLAPFIAEPMGAVDKLFGAGSIGGNIASVVTQFASIRNTLAETGAFAVKGYAKIFDTEMYNLYKSKSRLYMGRQFEPAAKNQRMFGSKTLSKTYEAISDALGIPVSTIDRYMVGGAWLSGYYKGKAIGLKGDDLFRYADDVAERTQASANLVDRPPINYGKIKTALGKFQTFVYNEWSQLKEDIVKPGIFGEESKQGYGEGLSGLKRTRPEAFKKFLGYAFGTAILSLVYETLGLPNPLRQEDATLPGVKNKIANMVWGYIINSIPGVSTVRFGGTPIVQGAIKGVVYLTGDARDRAEAEKKLKSIGARLVPGGGQAYKTVGGFKALANKGRVEDKRGRLMFKIDDSNVWEIAKALVFGKYQTTAGQAYLDKIRGGNKKKKTLPTNPMTQKKTVAKKSSLPPNPLLN